MEVPTIKENKKRSPHREVATQDYNYNETIRFSLETICRLTSALLPGTAYAEPCAELQGQPTKMQQVQDDNLERKGSLEEAWRVY